MRQTFWFCMSLVSCILQEFIFANTVKLHLPNFKLQIHSSFTRVFLQIMHLIVWWEKIKVANYSEVSHPNNSYSFVLKCRWIKPGGNLSRFPKVSGDGGGGGGGGGVWLFLGHDVEDFFPKNLQFDPLQLGTKE